MAKANAQNPQASAESTLPAKAVSPGDLNGEVQIPTANSRAIEAVSNPELPGMTGAQPPAQVPAPTPAPAAPVDPDKDAAGEKWDPAKHDRRRTKGADGRWHAKRGRRSGPQTPAQAPAQEPAPVSVIGDAPGQAYLPGMAPATDRFDTAAEMYCQTGYMLFGALFQAPDEWRPDSDDEGKALKNAVAGYLRHKQTEDLPPGMTLALAVGSFAIPRFMRPKTRETIRSTVEKLRSKRQAAPAAFAAPVPQVATPAPENPPASPTSDQITRDFRDGKGLPSHPLDPQP